MLKRFLFLLLALCLPMLAVAKPPDIDAPAVQRKLNEIMQAHASVKKVDPELVRRSLINYIEALDPGKTYFIKSDIQQWIEPSDELVNSVVNDYNHANYRVFASIQDAMGKAILRRRVIMEKIKDEQLPTKVDPKEFKDPVWAADETALTDRLKKVKALQRDVIEKLPPDVKAKAAQRMEKYQTKNEDEILTKDALRKLQTVYANVLKATTSAMDTHTNYFTPEEAKQFLIEVQQRLFGIGAQLRDDLTGLTVVKIVEGGPAARNGKLKVKDRIITVDGEPVVGMDISDAVELIRGKLGTVAKLTVIRDESNGDSGPKEKHVDIEIERGEVVITDARYESAAVPFGEGAIAYLRLHTFYQDPETSSTADLLRELTRLKKENKVQGVVLDLRSNSGGLLSQAVTVTGLFMTKGVVVSIKDENGKIAHLRDIDGKTAWDGPLIILINRGSASAAEIVAQALQDYGRAIIVGDDHSYGKGSFQTFTLNGTADMKVNPEGEYKVTRGRYYTVSGRTPQLTGVKSDIEIPGALSFLDIGESFQKHPLQPDTIEPNFEDSMSDVPFMQRARLAKLYLYDLQPRLDVYKKYMERLKKNSAERLAGDKGYQEFVKEIKNKEKEKDLDESVITDKLVMSDFQLNETYNIMRDLILFMKSDKQGKTP